MLSDFLQAAHQLALSTGGSVTSGLRTAKHNATVGGVPNSLHLVALALDLVHDTTEGKHRAIELAPLLGLTALDEGDHLHIQPRKDPRH